jgi:hypothetical protein
MHPARHRLAFLSAAVIAVLAAVFAVVLPVTMASAASGPAAGNGVGASPPGMILPVGADQRVSAVQGRGEGLPQPHLAAGLCVAAEAAGSGADNVVNGVRLAQQLTRQEAESVFTQGGGLQSDVIAQSREIINGAQLGNKQLVSELTSAFREWLRPGRCRA